MPDSREQSHDPGPDPGPGPAHAGAEALAEGADGMGHLARLLHQQALPT
jgi:hypothetical protein